MASAPSVAKKRPRVDVCEDVAAASPASGAPAAPAASAASAAASACCISGVGGVVFRAVGGKELGFSVALSGRMSTILRRLPDLSTGISVHVSPEKEGDDWDLLEGARELSFECVLHDANLVQVTLQKKHVELPLSKNFCVPGGPSSGSRLVFLVCLGVGPYYETARSTSFWVKSKVNKKLETKVCGMCQMLEGDALGMRSLVSQTKDCSASDRAKIVGVLEKTKEDIDAFLACLRRTADDGTDE